MATDITTPEGRIIWGNPLKGQPKTDDRTKQPLLDQNGNPRTQWSFGLAIPKDQIGPVWAAMQAEAATMYPQGVVKDFAWKIKDGDTATDKMGQPLSAKPGYAGHYVLSVTTEAFQPRVVVKDASGVFVDIQPEQIKTGDYVIAALSFRVHGGQSPGLYVNPVMVLYSRSGEAIQSGPSASELFANAPASQVAPAAAMPTGLPGAGPVPTNPAPTPTAPAGPVGAGVPGTPTASPGNTAPPNYGFVDNATGAQPGQAPAPTPGAAPMPGLPG